MMRIGIKSVIIFIIIFISLGTNCFAINHYVRAGAVGDSSGVDWTNAYTTLPSSLTRGDTYYIADGNYGPYDFDDAESGTSWIYVKKATTSDHGTETGWNSAYGDGEAVFTRTSTAGDFDTFNHPTIEFSTDYYEMDGQVGSGKSGYGFRVTSTLCGSSYSTKIIQTHRNQLVSNITLKYIDIDHSTCGNENTNTTKACFSTSISTNITIQNCYLHHANTYWIKAGNVTSSEYSTDVLIEHTYFYRMGGKGEPYHTNALWFTFADNLVFRYNTIEDYDATTGGLCLGGSDNVKVYGNVFFCSDIAFCTLNNEGRAAVMHFNGGQYTASNLYFYNNTFVDLDKPGFSMGTNSNNVVVKNNLFWAHPSYVSLSWFSVDTGSHNAFGNGFSTQGTNAQALGSTESEWFKNYSLKDYHLIKPTAVADSTLGPEFNTDMDGNTRGGDGTWDRGAFEYLDGLQVTSPPLPPTNLRILSQD